LPQPCKTSDWVKRFTFQNVFMMWMSSPWSLTTY
jgi:hypothetical protein